MPDDILLQRSELLLQNILEVTKPPLVDNSPRIVASGSLCRMAVRHSAAFRLLAESEMFISGFVVLRAQFEATLRAVWTLYSATDRQIEKITATLTPESELDAKNLPQVRDMLEAISKVPNASVPHAMLSEFKGSAWHALNSYAHCGIHPITRLSEGYPIELILQNVKLSNGLAMIAALQYCILTGVPELQRELNPLYSRFGDCLPLASQDD